MFDYYQNPFVLALLLKLKNLEINVYFKYIWHYEIHYFFTSNRIGCCGGGISSSWRSSCWFWLGNYYWTCYWFGECFNWRTFKIVHISIELVDIWVDLFYYHGINGHVK